MREQIVHAVLRHGKDEGGNGSMSERGMKIAGKARRIMATGLVGCLLCGGALTVSASTLKDVFDAQYYADTYADLKEAYGYDSALLWEHFVTYGLAEGRTMNGLIDIVKYRESYADLEEAFGDQWDAYLEHYLTYGAKEGRDSGTDFNPMDYMERYGDLQEAFGEDVMALWQHYQACGVTENREARDEAVVQAEIEAAKQAEVQKPQENPDPSEVTAQTGWAGIERGRSSVNFVEYDSAGKLIRNISYQDGGDELYGQDMTEYEYDNTGKLIKKSRYSLTGALICWYEYEYDSTGKLIKDICYYADSEIGHVEHEYDCEYDSAGKVTKITQYFVGAGAPSESPVSNFNEFIFDSTGKLIRRIPFSRTAAMNFKHVYEYTYDSVGRLIRCDDISMVGNCGWSDYEYNDVGNAIQSTYYDADNKAVWMECEYNADRKLIKWSNYQTDGRRIEDEYDSTGKFIRRISYNADGSIYYVME